MGFGSPSIATPVAANLGGTGVANNAASTLTISGNFGTTFTVSGATSLTLPTSGTLWGSAGVVAGPDGTAGAPAFSFASQPSMGMLRQGSNNLGLAVNSTVELAIIGGAIIVTGRVLVNEWGSAAAPGYTWVGDADTGISHSANVQVFSANGVEQFRHNATDVIIASGIGFQVGNTAVTGLVAGALAALTTASIVIKDSTGTAYRVPCVTP